MRILVTGGAGFMGSHMIRYLLANYPAYEVLNLDKLTYCGNLENLRDVEHDPRYRFVHGDVADAPLVRKLLAEFQPRIVLHYAAETHVDRSIQSSRIFLETEILGTHTLLEAIRQQPTVDRMIQISTDEVFGSIAVGAFIEDSPFRPNSPYAAAKAGADLLCRAFISTFGVPVIVTHSCNFYGPYQYPEKFIPFFITNLLKNKPVPLYGDGSNRREWIYHSDHCRAVDRVMHDGVPGAVYNISTGAEFSNREVTMKILQLCGASEEKIKAVDDRPGHDWRYALSHEKLTKELGWEPLVSFDEGLMQTIAWYQENPTWWQALNKELS